MVPVEDYVYESKWHMSEKLQEILAFGWTEEPAVSIALTPTMAAVPIPWSAVIYGIALVLTVLFLTLIKGGGR